MSDEEIEEIVGKLPERIDHFDRYFEENVRVTVSTGPAIVGILVEIDDAWIVIQKPDGSEVSIRKKGVYAIGMIEPRVD
jgi:hypothetical protein